MTTETIVKCGIGAMAGVCTISGTANAQNITSNDLDAKYAVNMIKPGEKAPDFTLPTLDGKTISLSDFKGKYTVMDFWASWCPDCRKDAPYVVEMYEEFKNKGVDFIGISFDIDKEAWRSATKKYGITYTQVSELKKHKDSAVAKSFGVEWIPSLILIDPQGKVVLSTVEWQKMKKHLQSL